MLNVSESVNEYISVHCLLIPVHFVFYYNTPINVEAWVIYTYCKIDDNLVFHFQPFDVTIHITTNT